MGKLSELIAKGEISVEELASASELIERAKLVKEGIEACKKNISFPLATIEVPCYSYTDRAGEYSAWGSCTRDGIFRCWCNWGGDHEIGRVNLLDFAEVFKAFENEELAHNLKRFLTEQIEKAR